jgi:hypothetical protein
LYHFLRLLSSTFVGFSGGCNVNSITPGIGLEAFSVISPVSNKL